MSQQNLQAFIAATQQQPSLLEELKQARHAASQDFAGELVRIAGQAGFSVERAEVAAASRVDGDAGQAIEDSQLDAVAGGGHDYGGSFASKTIYMHGIAIPCGR